MKTVHHEMEGEGVDSYMLYSDSPPETLPGIKLPKPFGGLLDGLREERHHGGAASGAPNSRESKSGVGVTRSRWGWIVGALAILMFSIYYLLRSKRSRKRLSI